MKTSPTCRRGPPGWILVVCVLGSALDAAEAEVDPDPTASFSGLMEEFCFSCHRSRRPKGELNLEKLLAARPLVRNGEMWGRVVQAVEGSRMPPEEADQPSAEERLQIVTGIRRTLDEFDYSGVDDPGFEAMRRLTHEEYNNTTRDLLGADLRLASRFPAELSGASGFSNSANTLFLQSPLMERYIAAAERAIDLAFPSEPANEPETGFERAPEAVVFVAKPGDARTDEQAAREILERFLVRAYRRPPRDEELARVLSYFQARRRGGDTFRAAVKAVLQTTLISPNFLLRSEESHAGGEPYRINDWELASRLSYFLWATMPDDTLFELAGRGTLHEPAVLNEQIARMLADPRADTLGNLFAAQWLGFQHIGTRIRLDPIDNPWCTDSLMAAMREESSMFFVSLLRENRPLATLIDADYTYMNEELAKTLYGLEGIEGEQMRRVSVEDSNRGGLFGQASVLTVTSSHKSTSPIKRGAWILDTILGTPPPPPPPNAGELDEELEERDNLSFREKLALHSKDESCRSCHEQIDPLGFSLENFDYFGRWRESYGGRRRGRRERGRRRKPIDVAGKLPDGTTFRGPVGLKKVILEKRSEDLARQVASKLLAYGLGRQLEYYDEVALREILATWKQEDHRFQALLRGIVSSYPFQYKKNPSEESAQ